MNKYIKNLGRYRIVWLLLVTASAVAMTNYFFDPYGEAERLGGWTCFGLFVAAWVSATIAWRRHRASLRRWSGGLTFCTVLAEIVLVSVIRNAYFMCPLPPPTVAQQDYMDLMVAVERNDAGAVRAILKHDHEPDAVSCYPGGPCSDDTPLQTAVTESKVEIAGLLLDAGASATSGEPPNIVQAAKNGDVPMMRLLLHHGADLNCAADNYEGMPLWRAVENNHEEAVTFLLQHKANVQFKGANPNTGNNDWSLLKLARSQDNIPIAKLLKAAGAKE